MPETASREYGYEKMSCLVSVSNANAYVVAFQRHWCCHGYVVAFQWRWCMSPNTRPIIPDVGPIAPSADGMRMGMSDQCQKLHRGNMGKRRISCLVSVSNLGLGRG
jgi:hypothetical protein